jgi:hypothetical protein
MLFILSGICVVDPELILYYLGPCGRLPCPEIQRNLGRLQKKCITWILFVSNLGLVLDLRAGLVQKNQDLHAARKDAARRES